MAEYLDSLDALQTKLQNFIKKFEDLENNEPFSYTITNALKAYVSEYVTSSKKICLKLKSQDKIYAKSFDSLTQEYNKKEKALEQKLRQDTKVIREKYITKCQKLRSEIEEKIKEIRFEENNINMDIEFFYMASEQNIQLFEREYEENVSRFNYQLRVASDSYSQNTIEFNDALDKELEILTQKYNQVIKEYDQDTENIISNYQKNVMNLNSVLAKEVEKFNVYQSQIKELRRKESMELNDQIRSLMNERNEKNQNSRTEYIRRQAEATQDKDNKRQEYQMESQKIAREFVLSMTALDDKITKLRNDYNSSSDQEKRTLQYKLLELKNEQEKELRFLYSSNAPQKKLLRNVKSQYYKYGELEKKNTEKSLKNLNYGFMADTEKTNYQKKLLDLDRSYNIKSIIENESYEIKKYQEDNNEFENDMTMQIAMNNLEFNRQANIIRSENNLKNLKDEKDYDEVDTIHQIEAEKLICQIKSVKYEIESFEEIRKLLHRFEDNKYRLTYNYKTVCNVLEIEKCKVLDTLNRSMHMLNTKSSQMVLDTSKKAIDLKNLEYKQQQLAKINRNKLILNSEQKFVIYQMESFQREEALEISILNRNYFFELDTLGHDFLSEKYKMEYKLLIQNLSILSEILKRISFLSINTINFLYTNIAFRPEYMKNIMSFIKEYIDIIFFCYQRLIQNFHDSADLIIHERLEFEESLKYKGFYKNIEVQYKEDLKQFTHKQSSIQKEIDQLALELENNKQNLFALDNDLFIKRRSIKSEGRNPKIVKEEIAEIMTQYHQIEAENQKILKKISILSKDYTKITNQVAHMNISYARQQEEIKKMQITNAQSYYELQKSLSRLISSSIADLSIGLKFNDMQVMENYEEYIYSKFSIFTIGVKDFLTDTYAELFKFSNNEREAILKSAQILDSGYKTDLEEIVEDSNHNVQEAKILFSKEEALRNEEIAKFDRDTLLQEKEMKRVIQNHEEFIKKSTQDIQNEMDFASKTFYDDYYAICDNQEDIIQKQKDDIQKLTDEYEANRSMVFERFKKSKEQLNESLADYIDSRNEILNHLPEAVREQEKTIRAEVYKKNQEFDLDYSNIRNKNANAMREIQKNKDTIESNFQAKQFEFERELKINRQKEKKNHLQQLRKI